MKTREVGEVALKVFVVLFIVGTIRGVMSLFIRCNKVEGISSAFTIARRFSCDIAPIVLVCVLLYCLVFKQAESRKKEAGN